MPTSLITIAQQTQVAARSAALLSNAARNAAIEAVAQALENSTEAIFDLSL